MPFTAENETKIDIHFRPKNENESHLIISVFFFFFIHSVTKSAPQCAANTSSSSRRFSQTMASEWQAVLLLSHKMPWCALLTAAKNYNKSLEKLQDFSFKTETKTKTKMFKTKTKTFIFVVAAPRDQDSGLVDYITAFCVKYLLPTFSFCSVLVKKKFIFFAFHIRNTNRKLPHGFPMPHRAFSDRRSWQIMS